MKVQPAIVIVKSELGAVYGNCAAISSNRIGEEEDIPNSTKLRSSLFHSKALYDNRSDELLCINQSLLPKSDKSHVLSVCCLDDTLFIATTCTPSHKARNEASKPAGSNHTLKLLSRG